MALRELVCGAMLLVMTGCNAIGPGRVENIHDPEIYAEAKARHVYVESHYGSTGAFVENVNRAIDQVAHLKDSKSSGDRKVYANAATQFLAAAGRANKKALEVIDKDTMIVHLGLEANGYSNR